APDVAERSHLQQSADPAFVVRKLDDGHDVVLPDGPHQLAYLAPGALDELGEGLRAMGGVAEILDALLGPVDQRNVRLHCGAPSPADDVKYLLFPARARAKRLVRAASLPR